MALLAGHSSFQDPGGKENLIKFAFWIVFLNDAEQTPRSEMVAMPPLRSLEAFRAVMRQGTFSAAAGTLGLTPGAVSHRIRELERVLGTPLFERQGRKAYPTVQAHHYFEALSEGFKSIEAATRMVSQPTGSEILSIHCAPSFAAKWLMPRLKHFIADHPDTVVRLHSTFNDTPLGDDVYDDIYDVDIQYAKPIPHGCDGVLIAEETVAPLAAPGYIEGSDLDPNAFDFEKLTFLHSIVNVIQWHHWMKEKVGAVMSSGRNMHFDRSFLTLAAACDNLGVCLESTLLAESEIRSGRLVIPFGTKSMIKVRTHRMIWRKRAAIPRKIKVFREWLLTECEKTYEWDKPDFAAGQERPLRIGVDPYRRTTTRVF